MRRVVLLCVLIMCLTALPLWSATQSAVRRTVAVLPFEGEKEYKQSDLDSLTELFLTHLIKTEAYIVLERAMIDKVLQEQAFALSDFTADTDAVKIGELLSAESVLVGNLGMVGTKHVLTVRVIDVTTGVTDRAQTIEGKTIGQLSSQLERLARSIAENIDVSKILDRRNRWSIDTDATLVVMGGQFYAGGASVGVRLQATNRISTALYGGALIKGDGSPYVQGGLKVTVYPTNNLGVTAMIGLFPGLGVSYRDIEVTFSPMWLYGYNGFAATLGYSFGL